MVIESNDRRSIALIAAMTRNRVIGRANAIPWKLPSEQQYFRSVTLGHTVITGRKNYESMGRALPLRNNVILTRDRTYTAAGCVTVHSVEEAISRFGMREGGDDSPLFVIGGEQIYKLFMPLADLLYITILDSEMEGDSFFPEFDRSEWQEISRRKGTTDEQNPHEYEYYVYRRLRPHPETPLS